MRRQQILIIGAALLISHSLNAQINKGSVFLGGGVTVNKTKAETANAESNSNLISIMPAAGIAVRNNIIVGIQIMYGHSKNHFIAPPSDVESNSYGGGVFLRKYLALAKAFYLFGQTGLSYNSNNYTYSSGTVEKQKNWSIGINIYPGISYAVTKKFHLEAGLPQLVNLGYSKMKITGTATQEISNVNFGVNASSFSDINVGFRVFLSK